MTPTTAPPRHLRVGLLGTVAAAGLAAAASCAEDAEPVDAVLAQGETLYGQYCALCHGASGEGYQSDQANALGNREFLASVSDHLLWTGTARGRTATPMSAWWSDRGGPLSAAEIDALVVWIRHWQSWPTQPLFERPITGVAGRAQPLWDYQCAECHGERGQGELYLSVANPEFLAAARDEFIRYAISVGRRGTQMLGYHGTLTEQGIDDLVVLMRSWQQPAVSIPFEPPSHDLGELFIHRGGPQPAWDPDGRFIGVDTVMQAITDGEELALLDARPPSDYVAAHITGARSVPFYDAESYLEQLPPDHWYVTYCGCPHSISGKLYDFLKERSYPKVKVLDEGFFVWQERGYPTTTGPEPE